MQNMKAVGFGEITSGTSVSSKEKASDDWFLGTATLQAKEKSGRLHCSHNGGMQVSGRPGETLLGSHVISVREDWMIKSQMPLSKLEKELRYLEGIGFFRRCSLLVKH